MLTANEGQKTRTLSEQDVVNEARGMIRSRNCLKEDDVFKDLEVPVPGPDAVDDGERDKLWSLRKTRSSCTIRGSFRDVAIGVSCHIARGASRARGAENRTSWNFFLIIRPSH